MPEDSDAECGVVVTLMRSSWGGDAGAASLRCDGMLNDGWRIMDGFKTYPHPPFCRNLPSYRSIINPGVWKLSATAIPIHQTKRQTKTRTNQIKSINQKHHGPITCVN